MKNDCYFQAQFVAANAWRLLSLQDTDASSPSYGCFHYAYWRDKTSEFADARFQEAGATLGILSMPVMTALRAETGSPNSNDLYQGFRAGLINLSEQQYPEGCFDEWYKGERGIAATEFTAIAYGLAACVMGEHLQSDDRQKLQSILKKSGRWLITRTDKVKSNHQAAIGAALALIGYITGDVVYSQAARAAIDEMLTRQKLEGWFPEIGGMDLGYCGVLLDYTMLYTHITGDMVAVPAMQRLFGFMLPHLHPDGTLDPQAGICLNPYVSRLGSGLLSKYDQKSAAFIALLDQFSPGQKGLLPTLSDDLRLCRWSHLPLVTLALRPHFVVAEKTMEHFYPDGWTVNKDSLLAAYHRCDQHIFFAGAGGGSVYLYQGREMIGAETGIVIKDHKNSWSTQGYNPTWKVTVTDFTLTFSASLNRANYYFPGFTSRFFLRIGCVFPWSSRLMRWMIDQIRLSLRSAVNQSAAPVSSGKTPYTLHRKIKITPNNVKITDHIDGEGVENAEVLRKQKITNLPKLVDRQKNSITFMLSYSGKKNCKPRGKSKMRNAVAKSL